MLELENVLGRYSEIVLLNRKKDRQQNSILLVESVYSHIKRFNDDYIELSKENGLFSSGTAIIRNPQKIHTMALNEREDDISLVYDDDITVKMIGKL